MPGGPHGQRRLLGELALGLRFLEPEAHHGALARHALQLELAAVALRDALHDGEPEARAALARRVEDLEDALAIGLGDAAAVVGHLERDTVRLAPRAQRDARRPRALLAGEEGVLRQVEQEL